MGSNSYIIKPILGMIAVVTAVVSVLFFAVRGCRQNIAERAQSKCDTELLLEFQGVVSEFKTDVGAEKSTFMLNDSAFITIPRSSKEVQLNDGDTVIKIRGEHAYTVRYTFGPEKEHIFEFPNCD